MHRTILLLLLLRVKKRGTPRTRRIGKESGESVILRSLNFHCSSLMEVEEEKVSISFHILAPQAPYKAPPTTRMHHSLITNMTKMWPLGERGEQGAYRRGVISHGSTTRTPREVAGIGCSHGIRQSSHFRNVHRKTFYNNISGLGSITRQETEEECRKPYTLRLVGSKPQKSDTNKSLLDDSRMIELARFALHMFWTRTFQS